MKRGLRMKHIRKVIACIAVLALAVSAQVFVFANAEEQKPTVRLGDVTVYSATRDESIVTVPIYVDGTIDMQCYDFTVTYDSRCLEVQEPEGDEILNGITAFEGYQDVNTDTSGSIRIAGITTEDAALEATGQVGQLTFVLCQRISKDNTTTQLEISVEELGFNTEASDVATQGSTVTFFKSAAPDPTDTPATEEPTSQPSEEPYTRGDVNADGVVDAQDALLVLQNAAQLMELDEAQTKAADVNADGMISADDALQILQYAAQLIPEL